MPMMTEVKYKTYCRPCGLKSGESHWVPSQYQGVATDAKAKCSACGSPNDDGSAPLAKPQTNPPAKPASDAMPQSRMTISERKKRILDLQLAINGNARSILEANAKMANEIAKLGTDAINHVFLEDCHALIYRSSLGIRADLDIIAKTRKG